MENNLVNVQDNNSSEESVNYTMKPNNYMALAIFTTVCCCMPLGIVAIIKASKVNSLFYAKQYNAAILAANDAKKWSLIALIFGLAIGLIYLVIYSIYGIALFSALGSN